jgi:hypothetical protein
MENTTGHTPGPWTVYHDDEGVLIRVNDDLMGVIINGKKMDANAQLIEAAPEMYAVLVDLIEQIEAYDRLRGANSCAISPDAAIAAVATAKGLANYV